ncbi:hypothetical protein GCM10009539_45380 [Cryptosporangium japonicum]|uniref:Uncharacterized protein n=1 Tax=Cryptosporangium japonicum TaxID=80872 RepID=A0ABP3E7L9_9ACTN
MTHMLYSSAGVAPGGIVLGVSLDDIADELYALDPGSFTAARLAREKEARAAGDRDLAAQIKALRKPSMSAWLTNQLVRERREQIEPLLALGEQLRELQASVSAEQLRALTQQRHRLVYAVAQEARALGHERGQQITDAVARELEQTLHAALGDPAAAEAVRSGRLVSGLQYAGFGPVGPAAPAGSAARAQKPAPKDDLAEKRKERAEQLQKARAEAQEVLDRARASLVDAEASRDEAASAAAEAEERFTEARDRVDQLKLDLDDAEEAANAADHELKAARRTAEHARKAAQLAAQRVTGAEHRLGQLGES